MSGALSTDKRNITTGGFPTPSDTLLLSSSKTQVSQSADKKFERLSCSLKSVLNSAAAPMLRVIGELREDVRAASGRLAILEAKLANSTRNFLSKIFTPWEWTEVKQEVSEAVRDFDTQLGKLISHRLSALGEVRKILGGDEFSLTCVGKQKILRSEKTLSSRPISSEEMLAIQVGGVPAEFAGRLRTAITSFQNIQGKLAEMHRASVHMERLGFPRDNMIVVQGPRNTELRLVEVQPGRFAVYRSSPDVKREFLGTFWNADGKAERIVKAFLADKFVPQRVPPPSDRSYVVPRA